MPLSGEDASLEKPSLRQLADVFRVWNRKLHYYLGLYFLFFLWLFAFTGLLINHSSWAFAEFWPKRQVSSYERAVQAPPPGNDLAQARDLMRQVDIVGEIQWGAPRKDSSHLDFQVARPGRNFAIKADLEHGSVRVERTDLNAWGIMRALHTFTGTRINDTKNQRDWVLTTIWALSMDAVALGMVILVLGGVYMWFGLKGKRAFGLVALVLGIVTCGWLVFGLRLLYS